VKDLEALVAARRDQPSPVLTIEVPLLRLLSAVECDHLTRSLGEEAGVWEVATATERLWETLPDSPGLYMFVWCPTLRLSMAAGGHSGRLPYILYVGQTGGRGGPMTLRQRYKHYLRYLAGGAEQLWTEPLVRTRESLMNRFLKLRPLEFWYSVAPDCRSIPALEDRLIQFLNPPLNIARRPRIIAKPARPAFMQPKEV
jgi:hypothetical protein